jgi:hypothetical protein
MTETIESPFLTIRDPDDVRPGTTLVAKDETHLPFSTAIVENVCEIRPGVFGYKFVRPYAARSGNGTQIRYEQLAAEFKDLARDFYAYRT